MKKVLTALSVLAAMFCACTEIDELNSKVNELEDRMSAVEKLCDEMNSDIALLQKVAKAQEGYCYIESIQQLSDGVAISFTDGSTYSLKNGEKGGKGDKGIQGEKGDTGASPIVSIGVDGGVSYWKVNDEWILVEGKKVSAIGVTPQMKIENQKWMISYDAGATWNEVAPAYDESTAITISQTEDEVTFSLHDGTKYVIAKTPGFKFKVSDVEAIAMAAGSTKDIPYTISKGDETVRFIVQGNNYSAVVVPTDATKGIIKVTAPDPIVEGWVLVTAVQNSTGESKAQYLEFGHGDVAVVLDAQQVETLGGIASVAVKSNIEYNVTIPVEAQDWISLVPQTKGYTVDTLKFNVLPNYTGTPRQATVTVTPAEGAETSFVISQAGEAISPEFGEPSISSTAKGYEADTVLVNVVGTVLWTIELSEGLTASKMAGAGPAEVIVNIPQNTLTTSNARTITVKTSNESVATKEYTLTVNQAGAPDPNDYYALYMAGEDIEICGEKINKKDFAVEPRLVKLYELTKADDLVYAADAKGILFLDYDATDGKEDTYAPTYNLKPANVIIIGRYKNHQPYINLVTNGTLSWGPTGNKVMMKNVCLSSKNYMFLTGNATEDIAVSLEDCTIDEQGYYVFAESKKDVCFKSIKVNNCVINSTRALIGYTSAYSSGDEIGTGLVSMTNSVFYGKSLITYPTVAFRVSSTAYLKTPNLDVNFDHCTLYNVNNNNYGIFALYNAKKINYNYCVSEAALSNNSPIVMLPAAIDPKITDSTVVGNYGNNTASNTKAWAYGYSTTLNSGVSQSGNTWKIGVTPLTKADTATGYFPVNTTVVTNGAGASYATKLWKTWE